jgi:hypothetical protein
MDGFVRKTSSLKSTSEHNSGAGANAKQSRLKLQPSLTVLVAVLTFADSAVPESLNELKKTYSSRDQGGSSSICKGVIRRFVQYSINCISLQRTSASITSPRQHVPIGMGFAVR